jgi:hypothetical protein
MRPSYGSCNLSSIGADDFDLVVAVESIDRDRDDPGGNKDADDCKAEDAEGGVAVDRGDGVPEPARKVVLALDQPQRLYAADQHRHEH